MQGDRAEQALARLEAALARIETSADRAVRRGREVEARHETLREAVTETLGQLDAVIAGRSA